ncbi:4Fe-4S binding protein [Nonomuraea sp. NPDC050691]|uniref:4Fe-4S binding protein n=1 Tax=Nonomuraea sp. NPDC050691 TaxID=3155661 RepID=UPI0033E54B47
MMMTMARIPGVGLAKGLSVTLRHMLRKSVTQQYPEVKPDLPPRSRGVIALVEENCTSCMLCARECPDWCIYIDSHKETLPAPEGGRPRQRNVLDRFAIDFSLCMYCGICIEVCPFDALFWSPEFEYAEGDIRNLLHEKDRLGAWVPTVPPPPAHDPGAEPPKELAAAPRRPAGPRAGGTPAGPRAAGAPAGPRAESTPTGPRAADTPAGPRAGDAPTAPRSGGATSEPRVADAPGGPVQEPGRHPAAAEDSGASERPSTSRTADTSGTGDTYVTGHGTRDTSRTMANVRGIRPPGALSPSAPSSDKPATPPTTEGQPPEPPQGDTSRAAALKSQEQDSDRGRPLTREPEQAGEDGISPETVQGTQKEDASPATSRVAQGEDTSPETSEAAQGEGVPPKTFQAAQEGGMSPEAPQEPQGEGGALEPSSTAPSSGEELSTASGEPQPNPEPGEQTSGPRPRRRRMADPRSIRPPGRLDPDDPREHEEE